MVSSLAYIISNGIEKGQIKKEVQAGREAEVIFAMIEGAIMMSKLADDPRVLNRILNLLKQRVDSWKTT
jgi:TetR/AcrR family transcriptional regulator, transcriptional repressor for nem operon